jgi:hypothetical protein
MNLKCYQKPHGTLKYVIIVLPTDYRYSSGCRQRHARCDRNKPQCGRCSKALRECIYSKSTLQNYAAREVPGYGKTVSKLSLIASPVGTAPSPPLSLRFRRLQLVKDSITTASPPIDSLFNSPYDFTDDINRSVLIASPAPSLPRSDSGISTEGDKISFLLTSFSEGPGHWMDLFDVSTYFASYVALQAHKKPLLMYATVACAAKTLARVQGRRPVMGGGVAREAYLGQYPGASSVSWKQTAEENYAKAVSLLHGNLNPYVSSLDESESRTRHSHLACDPPACKRQRTSYNTDDLSTLDELLAVVAILCFYELLDNSVSDLRKHLIGAKSLLVHSQVKPLQLPTSTSVAPPVTKSRRACFWNIARQDVLAAFSNKTNTTLDTEALSLWREAGLMIDDQGCIISSSLTGCDLPEENDIAMKEELTCNALVWLMAKIVNFMASCDKVSNEAAMARADAAQSTSLKYWSSLRKQLQVWHDGLSNTFKSPAREPSQASGSMSANNDVSMFNKVGYMCASAMQMYHMSQILLFMNKPQASTQGSDSLVARMNFYQYAPDACQDHSRQIVSITLAQSDKTVRINAIQPLFTAGQCLIDAEERKVVLNLLRVIQTDTGWDTDHLVRHIIEKWQEENLGPV